MDYDPSKTAAYLQGRIDEYVKFSARDTIMRNVRNDRHARYARVPDGGACDFCKMLGSRGFVYHSEDKAGGDSFHGTSMDSYHPFCNCQIAVCFDPYVDEYKRNGVTVRRGYGDGEVTVPGRDGSDELRNVDIDELFEQYKSMTANFGSGSSKYRDYSRAGFLTSEAMDKARKLLEGAATMDELEAADAEIMRMWQPGSHVGRNQSQWDELRKLALDRKNAIGKSYRGIQRDMSNGARRSPLYHLNEQDVADVEKAASEIGIPVDVLSFNTGTRTSYSDASGKINIRGDVFPDERSRNNRDSLSVKATLAHEYYGHGAYPNTKIQPNDWRDEFRASYRAAIDTPNLSDEDRRRLMIDAYERASEVGAKLNYTRDYRRIVHGYEE